MGVCRSSWQSDDFQVGKIAAPLTAEFLLTQYQTIVVVLNTKAQFLSLFSYIGIDEPADPISGSQSTLFSRLVDAFIFNLAIPQYLSVFYVVFHTWRRHFIANTSIPGGERVAVEQSDEHFGYRKWLKRLLAIFHLSDCLRDILFLAVIAVETQDPSDYAVAIFDLLMSLIAAYFIANDYHEKLTGFEDGEDQVGTPWPEIFLWFGLTLLCLASVWITLVSPLVMLVAYQQLNPTSREIAKVFSALCGCGSPEYPEQIAVEQHDANANRGFTKLETKGLIYVSFGTCIAVGVLVGMMFPWLLGVLGNSGVSDLQQLLAEGGSDYATDLQIPYVILGFAGVAVLGAVVAVAGSIYRRRCVGVAALALIFTSGVVIIWTAAYLDIVLDETLQRLQLDPLTANVQFTEKEQSFLDMTAILYNKCCFEVWDPRCGTNFGGPNPGCLAPDYDTGNAGVDISALDASFELRDNQGPVRSCDDPDPCGGTIFPTIVDLFPTIRTSLCTCYSNGTAKQTWESAIEKLGSCQKLEKLKIVDAANVEVPQSSITFSNLQTLVAIFRSALTPCGGSQVPADPTCASPITEMAVVGKIWAPEETFGGADFAYTPGWSCGLGFAKGLSFTVYQALEQAHEVAVYGAYTGGAIMVFLVFSQASYWIVRNAQDIFPDV